jgi:hypothetical protein
LIYEKYPELNTFNSALQKYIKNFNNQNTIASNFKKIDVPTTSYIDPYDGEINLKCYQTIFSITKDELKNADILTIRSLFFKNIISQAKIQNQDILKLLDSVGWIYHPEKHQPFVEWFLNTLSQFKTSDQNLKNIIFSKATQKKIREELNKPESRFKIFKWLKDNTK